MGRQKSPERIRIEELLSDGQWHDRDDLFIIWAEKINPAKAQRAAVKSYAATHGTEERSKEVSEQHLEMYGAKHIFNQLLGSLRSTNRIEERKIESGVEIRFLSEDMTVDLDSYSSIIIVNEINDENVISIYDPRQNVLIISLKRLNDWSDQKLKLFISWCKIREDEGPAFGYAKLMAQKILNYRHKDFAANRRSQ